MGVVIKLSGQQDTGASLAPLVALVEEDMAHVNRIILDRARSNVELIPELARYLIDSGGKRLRPMLEKSLRPGTRVVSVDFQVVGWKPVKTETALSEAGTEYKLYLYVRE